MAHYGIGIGFAFVLLLIWGVNWLEHPSLFPAILIGISTTLAPFYDATSLWIWYRGIQNA